VADITQIDEMVAPGSRQPESHFFEFEIVRLMEAGDQSVTSAASVLSRLLGCDTAKAF
jgi:hypothetical protein